MRRAATPAYTAVVVHELLRGGVHCQRISLPNVHGLVNLCKMSFPCIRRPPHRRVDLLSQKIPLAFILEFSLN
jgi:hypothetical protein